MNLEQEVFEKAMGMKFPIHKFKNIECIFCKGFKFEKITDVDTNTVTYNVYNTRSMSYKKLNDDELKDILTHGIHVMSDVHSYVYYNKIVGINRLTLENKKCGYKVLEKAQKTIDFYMERASEMINKNINKKELFNLI